jgi:predicted TIM-barrel fold metal-dependent hydrolase
MSMEGGLPERMVTSDIVDAHHHLWSLTNHYPWLQENAGALAVHGDDRAIRRDYLIADYLADAGSLPLKKSVHIDAGAADPWIEAQWLQQVSDVSGFPHAIVAGARLADPAVGDLLDNYSGLTNFRGIRDILNWHPDPSISYIDRNDLMTDPAWLRGFAQLEPRGLSFDLQVYPDQLQDAARLAAEHPSTAILLNHAGMPVDRTDTALQTWRDGLRAMAAQDNVLMKISGIGMSDHRWTPESLATVIRDCIEAFGPARCMFGSNFPVDCLYSSYAELYGAFDDATTQLSGAERDQLFGTVAAQAYRI